MYTSWLCVLCLIMMVTMATVQGKPRLIRQKRAFICSGKYAWAHHCIAGNGKRSLPSPAPTADSADMDAIHRLMLRLQQDADEKPQTPTQQVYDSQASWQQDDDITSGQVFDNEYRSRLNYLWAKLTKRK